MSSDALADEPVPSEPSRKAAAQGETTARSSVASPNAGAARAALRRKVTLFALGGTTALALSAGVIGAVGAHYEGADALVAYNRVLRDGGSCLGPRSPRACPRLHDSAYGRDSFLATAYISFFAASLLGIATLTYAALPVQIEVHPGVGPSNASLTLKGAW